MICPQCGCSIEEGRVETHVGSACVTIDVYYVVCSNYDDCGYYEIGTTPNKACSRLLLLSRSKIARGKTGIRRGAVIPSNRNSC